MSGRRDMNSVPEKTLELNVNENLINRIRQLGRSFEQAFLYGFTLRYEARWGLDSSIKLPSNVGFLLALQYKKFVPERSDLRKGVWAFEINNNRGRDQHLKLLVSSYFLGEDAVYYAFPMLDREKMYSSSPHFLERTCFARVADFPSRTFNYTTHIVFVKESYGYASVMSEDAGEVRLVSSEGLLERVKFVDVRRKYVEELSNKKINREDLEEFLKKKDIDREVIRDFLSRNWKQYFSSGIFV
ncbi:MAG: hypothetical protein J7L91_00085 [Candidatus Korarchaeota archaeon]|nr:hypothetical protein [Candidatus Korarchaeota archaeon]